MKPFASLPITAVAALASGLVLLFAPEAVAQPRRPPASSTATTTTTTTTKTEDYTERVEAGQQVVKFTGDELVGIENGAFGMTVRRPPGSTRVGLIRPRLNFVPELLASVENL